MKIDHVSYAASNLQVADVLQRIGSQIKTPFIDGGVHPQLGTRNFIAPLKNNQYIEVVCPIDHPATNGSYFGKAVSSKAKNGGGWFAWVISTNQTEFIEISANLKTLEGHRLKPDGAELKWREAGSEVIEHNNDLPFFIKWVTDNHPSTTFVGTAEIETIFLFANKIEIQNYVKNESEITNKLNISELDENQDRFTKGIDSILFNVNGDKIKIE